MSVLLDDIIRERKQNAINYANYLKKLRNLLKKLKIQEKQNILNQLTPNP